MTIGFVGIAQQSAKEAPAGFNTPSFNSAQSVSNGIVEPPGDTFARDQNVYEENEGGQGWAWACLQRHFLRHLPSKSE
jgi:hypothetical protein